MRGMRQRARRHRAAWLAVLAVLATAMVLAVAPTPDSGAEVTHAAGAGRMAQAADDPVTGSRSTWSSGPGPA